MAKPTATDQLKAGTAAYRKEMAALSRWIRRRGRLTATQFDRVMFGRSPFTRRLRPTPIDGDSFIIWAHEGSRDWWLQILHWMQELGMVRTEKATADEGHVAYRLPQS